MFLALTQVLKRGLSRFLGWNSGWKNKSVIHLSKPKHYNNLKAKGLTLPSIICFTWIWVLPSDMLVSCENSTAKNQIPSCDMFHLLVFPKVYHDHLHPITYNNPLIFFRQFTGINVATNICRTNLLFYRGGDNARAGSKFPQISCC